MYLNSENLEIRLTLVRRKSKSSQIVKGNGKSYNLKKAGQKKKTIK